MANQFEQPALLSPQEAEDARKYLQKQMEESSTIFAPVSGRDSAWTFRVGGKPAIVEADYDHGTYTLDVNTGVVLEEATAADAFAYANHCSAFRYKAGEYQAIGADGSPCWRAGSTIHLRFCLLIGNEDSKFDFDDALRAARHCNDESLEGLAKVVAGESTVPDALDSSHDHALDHLRALLAS